MSAGEFARVDRFLRAFERAGGALTGSGVLLGPGDDAAVLDFRRPVAITTDAVVEGVHFRRDWSTWAQVGHKALAVNLSDLAAMGAQPFAFTCALGVPPDVDEIALDRIASGLGALAKREGIRLVGGNFTAARELSVTITALGELTGQPLRRDAAKPGDAVMLVGAVGVAAAELAALSAGRALPEGPSAQLEPTPLCEAGLSAAALVRCAIDVSDGLVQDLGHLAAASGVGIDLEFTAIPRSPRLLALAGAGDEATVAGWMLSGGEDYALVLCGDPVHAAALGAVVIGSVHEGQGVVVRGAPAGARTAGFDHFTR